MSLAAVVAFVRKHESRPRQERAIVGKILLDRSWPTPVFVMVCTAELPLRMTDLPKPSAL